MTDQDTSSPVQPMPAVLTTTEAAKLVGIQPASLRKYLADGRIHVDGYLGRTPYWYPATLEAWKANRPGQGVGGGRPRKDASSTSA